MSEAETGRLLCNTSSYLVDCDIVRSNPSGEKPNAANKWRNGVGDPLPDESAASNDHEELVTTHGPTVHRLTRASGVQTIHDRASDECGWPLSKS